MKLIYLSIVILFISCGNSKESASSNEEPDTTTEVAEERMMVVGTVSTSDKDCKLYIDVLEKDKTFSIYPVNLDEKFQVDGMKLKFYYEKSRAPQPEGCSVDFTASVSGVSIMR